MGAKQGYSRLTDGQLMGLQEAGASASEILAYAVLTRKHEGDKFDNAICWASVKLVCERTGMSPNTATKALQGLCRKTFVSQGTEQALIVRIAKGHKGMVTRYTDNLWREVESGRYPDIKY